MARKHPKKAGENIHPGELVYVKSNEGVWHLGRTSRCCAPPQLIVEFHDGEVALVDFTVENHCMASRHGAR